MGAIPIPSEHPQSIVFLASFSKYCETIGSMYIFDDVVNFLEDENLGYTKDQIKSARDTIEKYFLE